MSVSKEKLIKKVDSISQELLELSHFIYSNPELGLKEYKACEAICSLLEEKGFEVKRNVGGLETAFSVTVCGNGVGPHVAICAEYDALAGIGHGCGHNIIATCGVGAFIALSEQMDSLPGKLSLIGTPAEESVGGKLILLREHVFDDIDFAMMIHPTAGKSMIARGARTSGRLRVRFNGKAAHSSAPEKGINALNCAVAFYNGIDSLRQTFQRGDNINVIIIEGGTASNIIPHTALLEVNFRTEKYYRLSELMKRVCLIADGAAAMYGATVEKNVGKLSYERYPNMPLSESFKRNMESLGEKIEIADNTKYYGSSDMNDVSIVMPMIHDYICIADDNIVGHTPEFRDAAGSRRGDDVCLIGAKALAMTAMEVLQDTTLQKEAYDYYWNVVPDDYPQKRKRKNT